MTENNVDPRAQERRIAAAQAARQRVDSQGKPKGKLTKFVYGPDGLLVSAEPADE